MKGSDTNDLELLETPPREGSRTSRATHPILVAGGILFVLGWVSTELPISGQGRCSSWSPTKADVIAISSALDDYALNNGGHYPEDLRALVTSDENGEAYLKQRSVPLDAWGNPYLYEAPTDVGEYAVYTLGRDGLPGGSGDDEDLSNLLLLGEDWSAR